MARQQGEDFLAIHDQALGLRRRDSAGWISSAIEEWHLADGFARSRHMDQMLPIVSGLYDPNSSRPDNEQVTRRIVLVPEETPGLKPQGSSDRGEQIEFVRTECGWIHPSNDLWWINNFRDVTDVTVLCVTIEVYSRRILMNTQNDKDNPMRSTIIAFIVVAAGSVPLYAQHDHVGHSHYADEKQSHIPVHYHG